MKNFSVRSTEYKEVSTGATIITNPSSESIYCRPVGDDTEVGVEIRGGCSKEFDDAQEVKGAMRKRYTIITVDGNEVATEVMDYVIAGLPYWNEDGIVYRPTRALEIVFPLSTGGVYQSRAYNLHHFPRTADVTPLVAGDIVSSDEGIATAVPWDNPNGDILAVEVVGVAIGTCTVTVTKDGVEHVMNVEVTEDHIPTAITIDNKTELETPMFVGDVVDIETTVVNENTNQTAYLKMTEGKYMTAYVSGTQVVAYKEGVQTLRAKDIKVGNEDTAQITVFASTQSISMTLAGSVVITETEQATVTHVPATAPVNLVYSSDAPEIASVDPDTGLVTGEAVGFAVIDVVDTLSGRTDSSEIEVTATV